MTTQLATVQVDNPPQHEMESFLNTLFAPCTQGFVEIRQISDQGIITREWKSLVDPTFSGFPNDQNIYVGVATRQDGKGGKANIEEIPAVWVDIDFKDIDRNEVDKRIKIFSLQPSIIVNSGNGYHLYWILKTPAKINDIQKIEDINKRLVNNFGGDKGSADAAHILRLPGTYNIKYNPPRPVTLQQMKQDVAYDLNDFDFLQLPPSSLQPIAIGNPSSTFTKLLDGVNEGNRHTTLVSLAGHFREKNLPEDETQRLLTLWNRENHPPLEEKELKETIKYSYSHYAHDISLNTDVDFNIVLDDSIMSMSELIKQNFIPKPFLIKPWLRHGEIGMITAGRGIGKTWLALSIALAATRSYTIGGWETDIPTGCMYLDGEMSKYWLQSRIIALQNGLVRDQKAARLKFLSSDYMRSSLKISPKLTNPKWRKAIFDYLIKNQDIRLLIIDNLACLTPGIDENLKKDWDDIAQWLYDLRALEVAVILIHHTGKGGEQRGTSAREDALDFSIKLKRPEGYLPEEGANFIVEFTKTRELDGNAVKEMHLNLRKTVHGVEWEVLEAETKKNGLILSMLKEGNLKQTEIAKELGVSPAYVSQVRKKAKEEEERVKRMETVLGDAEKQTDDSPMVEEVAEVKYEDQTEDFLHTEEVKQVQPFN
ncbi:MAG: AAA family ATPase [Deltaproteobacteria bacterium]|nr:AAA family ATPase [Deltaproteobacteria bacterium]